nr:putative reverse transcriptase domain-containing protein [Tanacetum cinerariifolium]
MLKISPWKGVVRFGKRGKINPRYVVPFKVLDKVGTVAYKLELLQELSRVHNTFHVSNLKKFHADEPLAVPLDGLYFDEKLYFVEEPIEIVDWEVKQLKQNRIPLVNVRWNSRIDIPVRVSHAHCAGFSDNERIPCRIWEVAGGKTQENAKGYHVVKVCEVSEGKRIEKTGAKAGIYGFVTIKSAYYSKSRQSRENSPSMPSERARENESNGAFGFYWANP